MKTIVIRLLGVVLGTGFLLTAQAADKSLASEKEKFSYAVGVNMGMSLQQQGVADIDTDALAQAIGDVLSGRELRMTPQEMEAAFQAFQKQAEAAQAEAAQKAKAAGDKYRSEFKKKKGVKALPSGILYEVLRAGKGKKPAVTDTVTVHYEGSLISGQVFDSSVKRGQPASFSVNGVIKGWQEVVPMMPVGSKWRVVIPPELAYGEQGAGRVIGPNETLVFEIELLSIKE
ncbi:MAG: FKBP-type peptidyl-prolyl cis-trans isomerase [Thiohalomonadaceae bacterium]